MKSSRFYQNYAQMLGSIGEIVLFLCGFFLGKGMFTTAAILLIIRIIHKIAISELMYCRSKSVIHEGINGETIQINTSSSMAKRSA